MCHVPIIVKTTKMIEKLVFSGKNHLARHQNTAQMSFHEKVGRQKSARWARASAAKYDGDDWSDDDYEENEVPAVPKLPGTAVHQQQEDEPQEREYDSSNQDTPNLNLEQQFKAIDLDAELDEYADLIKENEKDEEDDEYRSQTSGRFQTDDKLELGPSIMKSQDEEVILAPEDGAPVVVLDQKGNPIPQIIEPAADADEPDHIAELDDYMEEVRSSYSRGDDDLSRVASIASSFHQNAKAYELEEAGIDDQRQELSGSKSPAIVQSPVFSIHSQAKPLEVPVQEVLGATINEPGLVEESNNEDEYLNAVPVDSNDNGVEEFRYGDIDESDDEFVPGEQHFRSTFTERGGQEGEGEGSHQPRNVRELLTDSGAPSELAQPLSVTIDRNDSPHSIEKRNLTKESPAQVDLSDTDTLHIQHEESDGSSIIETGRHTIENPQSANTNEEDFNEHAYLGSMIDTPDPDSGTFSNQQHYPSSLEAKEAIHDVPSDTEARKSSDFRDSKFYSSVNDYFDDYADENTEKRLTKLDSGSSGSLSTGGASIKSENDYRSSKLSDRTASFTNQSLSQYSEVQSYAGSNAESNSETETKEPSSLNQALSINLGQWRPNTDSFRDQFISGSSSIPPVPKLEIYKRNSRGEIVEETSSIAESKVESVNSTKDESDLLNSSFESKDTPYAQETYRTNTNSMIPTHIPLSTPDLNKDGSNYFHENLTELKLPSSSEASAETTANASTKNRPILNKNDNSYQRISKYRELREIELNIETGLSDWLEHSLTKVEVVSYQSSGTNNNVQKAYAEASSNSKKHNNLGSILHKTRVLQETGSTAQSFAKGLFHRGRKIIKSDK